MAFIFFSLFFDDTLRTASVARLLVFAGLSAFFAFAARDALAASDVLSGALLIGLSFGATALAGSEVWHLLLWNNRDVTVDDVGIYVAGIELSVDWSQLVAVDRGPSGLILRTTLARNDWVVPARNPEAIIERIREHPSYCRA